MRLSQTTAACFLSFLLTVGGSTCERDPLRRVGSRAARDVSDVPVTVEPFGLGTITTPLPEFGVSFAPDGQTVYFGRASEDRSELSIMISHLQDDGWTEPVLAPFSGTYRDVDAFVSPEGRRIYFSSDRPRVDSPIRSFSTWYVEKFGDRWSEPMDPGWPINSDSTDVFFSAALDGTVVFGSNRDGTHRVYMAHASNGVFTEPEPLFFGTLEHAVNPLISPDATFMLIVLESAFGAKSGGADLFATCRSAANRWTEPVPLSRVNSRYADFAPALHPLEAALFFTSERPGTVGPLPDAVRPPGDILRVSLDPTTIDCRYSR